MKAPSPNTNAYLLDAYCVCADHARRTRKEGQLLSARCSGPTIAKLRTAVQDMGASYSQARGGLVYQMSGRVVAGPGQGSTIACVDGIDITQDDAMADDEVAFDADDVPIVRGMLSGYQAEVVSP